ncbi:MULTISPECIES: lysophospholipid acyltransferase family protein [Clostridium]|jgi:1-acyl-sn-glycerol-3-phosphate acyltransferase|uniref:lysophospholipid acyltransferase family protein n=1 Tax=Clostridium TaxID=1485 RepID=UPI00062E5BF4|nr:lysophospholipid acyltransferase family protein [Clostridium sp. C8]KLE14755.1 1-acyl-sn-glycerol-3-phosphate acyltransferase [Clostridium sp. C8]
MLRSIAWYVVFFMGLLRSIPSMIKTKRFNEKDMAEEKERLTFKATSAWANSLLKVAGVRVNVHGLENLPKDQNVLFIGNHQGNFDIPIYISKIPVPKGFVSKIEVKKIPGVSTWMEYMHCVFMDRSNLRKAGEAIIQGVKVLKNGHSLVIFPEGTRSKGDKMGEFKAGSFKLATKSKVPIVPVTMSGSYKIMESNKRKWIIKPANVDLYIHPAIETTNLTKEEQDILPKKVYEIVKSKLPN